MPARKYNKKQLRRKRRHKMWTKTVPETIGRYGTAMGKATSALSMAYKLASLINVEYKHLDFSTYTTPTTIAQPWQCFIPFNQALPQGTGTTERNGKSVKLTSINMKFHITRSPTATDPVDRVRCVLFEVLHNDGIDNSSRISGPQGLFDDTVAYDIRQPRQLNDTSDFKVLFDKTYHLTALKPYVDINKYMKSEMHLKWQEGDTVGLMQNVEGRQIYFGFMTDQAVLADQPNLIIQSRLRFVDN